MPQFGDVKDKLPKDLVLLNYKNIFKAHEAQGGFFEVLKDNISFYKDIAKESFRELFSVGKKLFADRSLKFFLSSFFFYSVGMQTIFLMATPFGSTVVFPKSDEKYKLIATILIIQLIAIVGAYVFSRLSKKIGNRNVITIAVVIWIGCCLCAFLLNKENPHIQELFYGLAAMIGLVMGGLQAMSRSTYSKLLPENSMENTTFFSFYDVLEKLAIICGMIIFSIFIQKFGNMQYAFIAMSGFFAVGAILIRFLRTKI